MRREVSGLTIVFTFASIFQKRLQYAIFLIKGVQVDRKYFKTDEAHQGFFACSPMLQGIMQALVEHCEKNLKVTPIITETKTTAKIDKALGRVSVSHQEGRAFDLRTWNLTDGDLRAIHEFLTASFGHIGAWTRVGTRQLIVHHDSGHGDHFHVQIDRSFAVK